MKTMKIAFSVLLILAMVTVGCAKTNKYAEVEQVWTEYISATEKLSKDVDAAVKALDVAKAIGDYTKVMKTVGPKLDEFEKKYPELKTKPPKEMAEAVKKYQDAQDLMNSAIENVMQNYIENDAVLNALNELAQ